MVDLGNALNIINKKQVQCLGLHLDTLECFPINVPGPKHIQCEGVAHKVDLTMEYYSLKDDFYVIDVVGVAYFHLYLLH